MLHENERVSATDRYFVCGGNPDGNGGGIIGSRNDWSSALALKVEAIKQNYNDVQILTWAEMMEKEMMK